MLGLRSIETQTPPPVRAVARDNVGGRIHAVNRREAGDELCAHLSHESALAWLGSLRNRVCISYLNCCLQVEPTIHAGQSMEWRCQYTRSLFIRKLSKRRMWGPARPHRRSSSKPHMGFCLSSVLRIACKPNKTGARLKRLLYAVATYE